MANATAFRKGHSQVVRLPREFHIRADEDRIHPAGTVGVTGPIVGDWVFLDLLTGPLDDDFVRAAPEPPADPQDAALDFFR